MLRPIQEADIASEFAFCAELDPFIQAVRCTRDGAQRDAIRKFYTQLWRRIKTIPRHEWAIDVYAMDWTVYMTPIEFALWSDIRDEGAVMYPQYPVGPYFVDFGNPRARVAIECDGKEWHKDKEADRKRQADIEARGWTVYRLTGRQCNQNGREYEGEFGETCYERSPGQELIHRLSRGYSISNRYAREAA